MNIFWKEVNYHHDNLFFEGFWEVHYKIHGNVSLDCDWDLQWLQFLGSIYCFTLVPLKNITFNYKIKDVLFHAFPKERVLSSFVDFMKAKVICCRG
jgi:hypothetical protein